MKIRTQKLGDIDPADVQLIAVTRRGPKHRRMKSRQEVQHFISTHAAADVRLLDGDWCSTVPSATKEYLSFSVIMAKVLV